MKRKRIVILMKHRLWARCFAEFMKPVYKLWDSTHDKTKATSPVTYLETQNGTCSLFLINHSYYTGSPNVPENVYGNSVHVWKSRSTTSMQQPLTWEHTVLRNRFWGNVCHLLPNQVQHASLVFTKCAF